MKPTEVYKKAEKKLIEKEWEKYNLIKEIWKIEAEMEALRVLMSRTQQKNNNTSNQSKP